MPIKRFLAILERKPFGFLRRSVIALRRGAALLLAVVLLMLPVGCGWMPSKTEKEATGEPRETAEPPPPDPLTGLPSEGPAHPTLMVMVNNHRKARPQSGLNRADLVVEILAEGEITRFAAFYHSRTEGKVGPVRSLRPYYLELGRGLNAVVVHAGGSTAALQEVRSSGWPSLDGIHQDAGYFRRERDRRAPHNLYTDLSRLQEAARTKGYGDRETKPVFRFDENGATAEGEPAAEIDLVYHKLYEAGYRYDEESGEYVRYTQGEKQVDRETGEPLTMDNVLVIKAKHRVTDAAGHREVDLKGPGSGVLFQRGKAIPIQWENISGVVVPVRDGQMLPLLPGKTWINVLPETGKVTYR